MRIKENLVENGKISQYFTKGVLLNIKVYACASFIPLSVRTSCRDPLGRRATGKGLVRRTQKELLSRRNVINAPE